MSSQLFVHWIESIQIYLVKKFFFYGFDSED